MCLLCGLQAVLRLHDKLRVGGGDKGPPHQPHQDQDMPSLRPSEQGHHR